MRLAGAPNCLISEDGLPSSRAKRVLFLMGYYDRKPIRPRHAVLAAIPYLVGLAGAGALLSWLVSNHRRSAARPPFLVRASGRRLVREHTGGAAILL